MISNKKIFEALTKDKKSKKRKNNTKKQETINKLISELTTDKSNIPDISESIPDKPDKPDTGGSIGINNLTTTRQLYINKYSNIINKNPNNDTLLNRTILKYILITPSQQILNEIINKEIKNNETMKAEIVSIPYEYKAPPPATPNQTPLSAPQLVPESLSRPQIDILNQIRKGMTLKKGKILNKSKNKTEELLSNKLNKMRKYIKEEEPDETDDFGEGFTKSNKADDKSNAFYHMYRRQLVYGF